MVCSARKASDQPAHNSEFLSLKGGCTGSSESTFVKMPYCLKSHVAASFCYSQSSDTFVGKIFVSIFSVLHVKSASSISIALSVLVQCANGGVNSS